MKLFYKYFDLERLAAIANERNVTFSAIAQAAGMNPNSLSKNFHAKTAMSLFTVYVIVETLNLSRDEIIDVFFKGR